MLKGRLKVGYEALDARAAVALLRHGGRASGLWNGGGRLGETRCGRTTDLYNAGRRRDVVMWRVGRGRNRGDGRRLAGCDQMRRRAGFV